MKRKFCTIREDLLEKELFVPIGENFVNTKDSFEYRWINEQFEVFYAGIWQEAESIDFDF